MSTRFPNNNLPQEFLLNERLYSYNDINAIREAIAFIRKEFNPDMPIDLRISSQLKYIASQLKCVKGEVEMMQNIWSWRRKAARENSLKQKRGINSFMLFKMDIGLLFKEAVRPGQTSDQRVMSKLYSTIWNWFKDGTECRNIFNFYQHLCDFGDSYENDLYISNFILQGASLTILVLEEMGIVQPNHDYQAFLKNVNSSVLGIKDFSPSDMERVRVSIESALPMQFEDLQVADTNVLFPDFNI